MTYGNVRFMLTVNRTWSSDGFCPTITVTFHPFNILADAGGREPAGRHHLQKQSFHHQIGVLLVDVEHLLLQVENQLASLTSKYTRLAGESDETRKRMKSRIETLEAENANLSLQLDDEKR